MIALPLLFLAFGTGVVAGAAAADNYPDKTRRALDAIDRLNLLDDFGPVLLDQLPPGPERDLLEQVLRRRGLRVLTP